MKIELIRPCKLRTNVKQVYIYLPSRIADKTTEITEEYVQFSQREMAETYRP